MTAPQPDYLTDHDYPPVFHPELAPGWLAAVLVLQAESWALLTRELGLDPRDEAALAEPQAEKAVLARAEAALHAFPGYARLRRVHLTLEEWTEANGLLTATHKLRRSQCLARYRAAIEGFYEG